MSDNHALVLRVCTTWDECVQCEEVQKQVWDMPDFRDVVPASFLVTAAKNGGILIGAFQGAQMVGFAFGFMGSEGAGAARRLKHTSHMLGVLPHVRVHGLGARMKFLQRQVALAQGLDLMTWTYDPLQAANAQLNLHRLGALARRYIRDAYGDMTDALNAGIASDRFEVEWLLTQPRVDARAAGELAAPPYAEAADVYAVEWTAHDLARVRQEFPFHADTLRVEIPADLGRVKRDDLTLAVEWRAHTRATFERAFAAGYAAIDFARTTDAAGRARAYYILQRASAFLNLS